MPICNLGSGRAYRQYLRCRGLGVCHRTIVDCSLTSSMETRRWGSPSSAVVSAKFSRYCYLKSLPVVSWCHGWRCQCHCRCCGRCGYCETLAYLVRNALAPEIVAAADFAWQPIDDPAILEPDLAASGQQLRPALVHLDGLSDVSSLEGPSLLGQ